MLLFASKKKRKEILEEIKENPLIYNETEIEMKSQVKWLGEIIASEGGSITATSLARKGRIINTIHEVITIVEETRM